MNHNSQVLILLFVFNGHGVAQELLPPLEALPPKPPFHAFPRQIKLPRSADPRVMVIGRLEVSPNRRPTLKLLGGDLAVLGADREENEGRREGFALAKDFRDLKNNTFVISTRPKGVDVARIVWQRPKLTFQWLPGVAHASFADQLANCVLIVGVDELHTQSLFLRQPQRLPSAPIRLAGRATVRKFPLSHLPALSTLRCEVLSVAGGFPKHYTNDEDIRMPRGTCVLNFGDGAVAKVKFGANINPLTQELMISTSPTIDMPALSEPRPWSANNLQRLQELNQKQMTDAGKSASSLRSRLKGAKKSARNSLNKEIRTVTRTQRRLASQRSLLNAVAAWAQRSQGRAGVSFRLYREIEGFEVDVAIGGSGAK